MKWINCEDEIPGLNIPFLMKINNVIYVAVRHAVDGKYSVYLFDGFVNYEVKPTVIASNFTGYTWCYVK